MDNIIHHRVVVQAHAFLAATLGLGVLLIGIPILLMLAQHVEGKYFPITTDITVKLVKIEHDRMIFRAYGTKVRNCSLESIRALVDTGGTAPVKGVIYPVDDGVGDIIRPLGTQDLGLWSIHPIGKRIEVQATYQCHNFYNTIQSLGYWSAEGVQPKADQ